MIIVIHPGSANLRIGCADSLPVTITHAVAIKRNKNGRVHRDKFLPGIGISDPNILKELEDGRLRMSHILQSSVQSNGSRRYATPPQQIAAFNRRSFPETIGDSGTDWLPGHLDTVVGDDIFRLHPKAGYNIHYPIKRGLLNIHSGVGGSLFNVLDHLQTIWEYAITEKLKIPIKDLANYKAVLVIPDIFNRTHSKELTSLLLNRMGFESCFLVQDHVAAMFGSGVGSACIVDVGAEKTSISCVDEGASQASTRVCLEYGGSDITHLFLWLLQKCSFPYKDCDLEDATDFRLISRLKEDCHLNLDRCGAQEHTFHVSRPGHPLLEYTLQFGDELLIAPLSLFHTELLNLTGAMKMARTQAVTKALIDPEDCFDGVYLRETGLTRRGLKEQADQEANTENADEDLIDPMDSDDFFVAGSQIIGIDQAILQSIERCPTDEMRKKMYSSVILVGGGCKFAGAEKWLQMRLSRHLPPNSKGPESVLASSAKETDPATVTWKGAAIMSGLESAGEMFINKADWNRQGVKILRERAPFTW